MKKKMFVVLATVLMCTVMMFSSAISVFALENKIDPDDVEELRRIKLEYNKERATMLPTLYNGARIDWSGNID